jgi:hypothetical protein
MRILRLLLLPLSLCLLAPTAVVAESAAESAAGAAPPRTPRLVEIRAAHHPGFDRVVFEFQGGLPSSVRVRYVKRIVADGSGARVRIAGRALLRVRFAPAEAHDDDGHPTVRRRRALALPNVMTYVRAGDFEGVTTYGLGLAKRTRFDVSTLRGPSRVVIDVRAAFRTVDRKVFFLNLDNFVAGEGRYFTPRMRPVRPGSPAVGVMDRLFAGPLLREHARGLRLLRSHAKGFADLAVEDGTARVRLTGGCDSDGSTVSIAGEIIPTLKQFPTVDRVKIYDPAGTTEDPTGPGDSIPECLEP